MTSPFPKRFVLPGTFLVSVTVATALLVRWFTYDPAADLDVSLPGKDGRPPGLAREETDTDLTGVFQQFEGVPSDLPGAWPRFRGPRYDNICEAGVALADGWGDDGPEVLWSVDLGEGHAGAAVLKGRVYVLDYDEEARADALRCFSLEDGREIWRRSYAVAIKRNHGMSRTVPAVTDRHVVALGPKCHVICLDSRTGELRWKLDLVKDFGTKVPPWYAGQCPLIDDGNAIIAPGGDDILMMAVACETGDIVWQTPNPGAWKMTHASIIPMQFAGRRVYVYAASGGVVGVAAEDGAILWDTTDWKISIATIASPLIVGDGRIFLTGGYNAGSMMLQLREEEGDLRAESLFRLQPEVFGATQQTPVLLDGYIYGVRPDGELVCLSLDGNVVWTSGAGQRFGLGPFMIAGGLIYAMDDAGVLTLAEAGPSGYRQLAQSRVLDGHDSWAPLAMAGGRLIARDMTRMVCLDVAAP